MPNWDNHIMRKYGDGIRLNILVAYLNGEARARALAAGMEKRRDELLAELLKQIPDDRFIKI